jgi:hypothetical protein
MIRELSELLQVEVEAILASCLAFWSLPVHVIRRTLSKSADKEIPTGSKVTTYSSISTCRDELKARKEQGKEREWSLLVSHRSAPDQKAMKKMPRLEFSR